MLEKVALLKRTAKKAPKPPKPPRKARRRVPRPPKAHGPVVRFLAWCVHFYTALGLVAAAAIAVLLVQGGPQAFRWSFILMGVATFVDSTDGTLARKIKIKDVLPNFDGRKLDDITDFLTYTFLPLLLVWRANLLPSGSVWCLLAPLLASAYGFCQSAAKTDDGYFLGFPSLWNVVAFYLYVLQPPGWFALALVLGLAFLTFVPSRYFYPSQPGRFNMALNGLAGVWGLILVYLLYELPPADAMKDAATLNPFRAWALVSLFYPLLYMAASWWVSTRLWAERNAERERQYLEFERALRDGGDPLAG